MLGIMKDWNPWWESKKVPPELKKKERDVDPLIFKAINIREVVVLAGLRRSGKTTIMYQMIDRLLEKVSPEQILYLNFDDPALMKQSLEDIYKIYLQEINPGRKTYFFLDEIQNIAEWEIFIKKYYDMATEVKFIVSGSSSSLLMGKHATLLTGRNLTFRIYPLTFKDFLEFSDIDTRQSNSKTRNIIVNLLNKYLQEGGFPEAYFKEDVIKKPLLVQYFNDILYKDVILRHNVNPTKIRDLSVYLLSKVSRPFTARKIQSFTGLATDSIIEYVKFLEEAFLLVVVSNFSYSLKEIVHPRQPRKAYCADTGLSNAVGVRFSGDYGRMAENVVCLELSKKNHSVYYWRGKGEVDFVVKNNDNSVTAINVTYTDTIPERETKALLEFKRSIKSKIKELIILTKDVEKTEEEIRFIPLWKWLLHGCDSMTSKKKRQTK